jgi:hypothetical protein
MQITSKTTNIRTIRQGDPKFTLTDDFVTCPRAGFEISNRCPENYKDLILECINHGWIKPVAHVYGKELTMDAMR